MTRPWHRQCVVVYGRADLVRSGVAADGPASGEAYRQELAWLFGLGPAAFRVGDPSAYTGHVAAPVARG